MSEEEKEKEIQDYIEFLGSGGMWV